jgi:hypothetical protein
MSQHSGASVDDHTSSTFHRGDTTSDAVANPFSTPQLSDFGHQSPPVSISPSFSSRLETYSSSHSDSNSRQLQFSEASVSGDGYGTARSRRRVERRALSLRSQASLRKPFPSTKLRGEIPKPWLQYPDPAQRWARIIFWSLFGLGFAASGISE